MGNHAEHGLLFQKEDMTVSRVRWMLVLMVVWLPMDGVIGLPPALAVQSNPIVIENQQPGTDQWQIDLRSNDIDSQIKGYASAASVNKGESITFYVGVNPAQTYTIDVYRIGWYQGLGGRLMQHIGPIDGVRQSTCPADVTTGMIACNWVPAISLTIPNSWTSGIYLARLTNAQRFQNYIIFVVRDDSRVAPLLYQQPVTTYQAYNNYPDDQKTGKSLYSFNSHGAPTVRGGAGAAKVSFDRPYAGDGSGGGFLAWEINFVRWMEKSGYDVAYSTNIETHTDGGRLLRYRGFLSAGHDEYWSKPMYDAVVAARDAGVNVAFFGADAISGQVRFESSSGGFPNRVMVFYGDANIDPIDDSSLKTIGWREPPLNRPGQTLMGVQYAGMVPWRNGYATYVVVNSGNWVYAGTGFRDGDTVPSIVGYEADHLFGDYPGPNSVSGTHALLSNSPFTSASPNSPNRSDYANSSVYQASSGAWVFASGTMSWPWALDSYGQINTVDRRIQRTTANILDRFIAD